MQSTISFLALAGSAYVSIESYRKNGQAIRAPVWIVSENGMLYCWTLANSGKVKRIRNNSRVRLAPCDAAGTLRGEPVAATARILDRPEATKAQARRMQAKYGIKFLPFRVLPYLRGTKPVAIEFSPVYAEE